MKKTRVSKPTKITTQTKSNISIRTKTLLLLSMFLMASMAVMAGLSVNNFVTPSTNEIGDMGLPYDRNNIVDKTYCHKIFGRAKPADAINILFVGSGYNQNEIFLGSGRVFDPNNRAKNLENDVNRLLYSTSTIEGYGLLTIEPFKSNLGKVNIYMLSTPYNFDYSNGNEYSFYLYKEMAEAECPQYIASDILLHTHTIIGYDDPALYNFGGGSLEASALHRQGQHNFAHMVRNFIHELGHGLGLFDQYALAYQTWVPQIMIPSYSIPNCDNSPGCSKWCSGEPLAAPTSTCTNFLNEAECNSHSWSNQCLWLEAVDQYLGGQCIRNFDFDHNMGTDCIAGTGCYLGCSGAGYRPTPDFNFTSQAHQRVDQKGRKHVYEPVSERFVADIFNCCYPSSCDNYDSNYCSDFSQRYSTFSEIYASCNTCPATELPLLPHQAVE
ncbi:MAG: hypothetical protein QG603_751 [Patescibacteria group bacterium]|nr:hypothetical protein [Patescibacteria group bacterium]MDQ5970974.1 hypothetical protein [Patescibacteria group bacterium]